MPEKCKLYNLESFTDEERQRVEDLINQIEEEKKAQKWWIMPKYPVFSQEVQQFGQSYAVEPQQDIYSRSKPPLKSDFESKEAAEKWLKEYLKEYLKEDDLFKEAIREITKLQNNLGSLVQKFKNHQYINNTDMINCFNSFHVSCRNGSLNKVIKE